MTYKLTNSTVERLMMTFVTALVRYDHICEDIALTGCRPHQLGDGMRNSC